MDVKVSLRWLSALLDGAKLDAADVALALTRAGLEVESTKKLGDFSGVVVAEVRGKRPHPDAQKLTLVDVWDGATTTQVVCGAPNVPEVGHKVLWARPGARLPLGPGGAAVEIQPKKVRGIESPGMLCAEDELGLGESHEGIIVTVPGDPLRPGEDASAALALPDEILDVAVGPNRPDCLGHVGVAREIAARLGRAFAAPSGADPTRGTVAVEIADPEACPRYHATVLEGVAIGPSPLALRVRLQALGVRAISNVVDVTNLVMLERAQPLHAFDLDTLPGAKVRVRRARADEMLETLDGIVRELVPADLLICDGADRPIALAGVMGGKATEVTAKTTRVLLECAAFDPTVIRATAKRFGLPSEASHRFERGVDPNGVASVAQAAAGELVARAGGQVVARADVYARRIEPARIALRAARTRAVTGLADATAERQAAHLRAIGLGVALDGDTLRVEVPTFRPDLTREVDLIEEIARLEGYERIPTTIPPLRTAPPELKHRLADRARDLMNALGLDEAITYAFGAPRDFAAFELPPPRDGALRLANPLRDELSAMRTTLLPGLLRAAARNLARGVPDVRLFELGHVFAASASGPLPDERGHIAAVLVGRRDGWLKAGDPVDVFDVRGVVDELLRGLGHAAGVEPSTVGWLHPGVQGEVRVGDRVLGHVGELHPRLAAHFEVEARALVFELELGALPPAPKRAPRPIPRHPAVERDISFFIDEAVTAARIEGIVRGLGEPLLVEVLPREDYRARPQVPAGKKSMLWSLVYRASDRTLTDAEVRAADERIVAALASQLGAQARA